MAAALTAQDAADAPERTRAFGVLADVSGADRMALAAQIRSVHRGALPLDAVRWCAILGSRKTVARFLSKD